MGKGGGTRPLDKVTQEEYNDNFENAFGKKKKKKLEPITNNDGLTIPCPKCKGKTDVKPLANGKMKVMCITDTCGHSYEKSLI